MKFNVEVKVTPKKALSDPQGLAVGKALSRLGLEGVEDSRVGRLVRFTFEAGSRAEAERVVEETARKFLSNRVVESFSFSLEEG